MEASSQHWISSIASTVCTDSLERASVAVRLTDEKSRSDWAEVRSASNNLQHKIGKLCLTQPNPTQCTLRSTDPTRPMGEPDPWVDPTHGWTRPTTMSVGMTNYRNRPEWSHNGAQRSCIRQRTCFGQGCPFWDILRHIRALTLTLTLSQPYPNPNPTDALPLWQ